MERHSFDACLYDFHLCRILLGGTGICKQRLRVTEFENAESKLVARKAEEVIHLLLITSLLTDKDHS